MFLRPFSLVAPNLIDKSPLNNGHIMCFRSYHQQQRPLPPSGGSLASCMCVCVCVFTLQRLQKKVVNILFPSTHPTGYMKKIHRVVVYRDRQASVCFTSENRVEKRLSAWILKWNIQRWILKNNRKGLAVGKKTWWSKFEFHCGLSKCFVLFQNSFFSHQLPEWVDIHGGRNKRNTEFISEPSAFADKFIFS